MIEQDLLWLIEYVFCFTDNLQTIDKLKGLMKFYKLYSNEFPELNTHA